MAVWLAADDYDLGPRPNVISATGLLKPLKCIVLSHRIQAANLEADTDLLDLVASRMGTAIHTAVESAWLNNLEQALTAMGLPKRGRDMVRVNPELPVDPEYHNVHIELRIEREIDGYIISGQFDFVENGRVKDIKSTSVYAWIFNSSDDKFAWQGSIYKWLNPKLITDDKMDIEFLFTDWKAMEAVRDKAYPNNRIMTRTLTLKSSEEVESFIRNKLQQLKTYKDESESEIPRCTSEELWQKPTTYAYYKKIDGVRATKLYEAHEHQNAMDRMALDGSTGRIDTRPGKVKFCAYCPARPICQQAENYIQSGLLDV